MNKHTPGPTLSEQTLAEASRLREINGELLAALEGLLAFTCDRGALCTSQPHLDARRAIRKAASFVHVID